MQELHVASKITTIAQTNTADFVFLNAATRPAHVALRRRCDGQWSDVTSAQFAAEVTALAKGLIAYGIEPGERVAIMSKTRYEWTVADFAVLTVGAVVVPIYETSSAEQVDWILSDSGARAIFVETAEHAALVEQVRGNSRVEQVWGFEADALAGLTAAGADVADVTVDQRRGAVGLDDLASIIYTSGTTGRPKGCELTHRSFVVQVLEVTDLLVEFLNAGTSTLLFLPIAHVFGRTIEIGAIAAGCTLGHTADVKNLLDDLADFHPTFVLAVPRVFEKVYNSAKQKAHSDGKGPIFDRAESTAIAYSTAISRGRIGILLKARHALFDRLVYRRLRAALGGACVAAVSGGAPLGARLGHFFRGVGVPIYEGYGLTETCAGVTLNRPAAIRIGTVGRPVGGTTARVAEDGELLFRAAHVFRGYWHNPDATSEVLDADGWFHTGDIGEIDDDGFVKITGRKKELIVTAGGKNVAPAVLEDRVRAHWLVSQCLVVGDQQPYVAALVTIDPEAYPQWLAAAKMPTDTPLADVLDGAGLRAEIQNAIDDANKAVSKAESIRRFTILGEDWTEAGGQVTPSLKLKRAVVMKENAADVAGLYGPAPRVNENHARLCPSPEWAEYLHGEVLEPLCAGVELGPRMLEVGPGPGASADWLRHRVDTLVAVEIDPETAVGLRARFAGTNVEIVDGDATALPFADNSFNTVGSFTMLHHVPTVAAQNGVFAEVLRVLRPGGTFVASDSRPSTELHAFHVDDVYNPIEPATLLTRLQTVGFVAATITVDYAWTVRARKPA